MNGTNGALLKLPPSAPPANSNSKYLKFYFQVCVNTPIKENGNLFSLYNLRIILSGVVKDVKFQILCFNDTITIIF